MVSMENEVDHAAKLFAPTLQHVDAFRLLMRQYRALVAGSSVLRLFVEDQAMRSGQRPQAWVPSDLDVYVSRSSLGEVGLVDWHVFFTMVESMKLEQSDLRPEESQYAADEVGGVPSFLFTGTEFWIGFFVCQ
jgi:hypothetical protein